MRKILAGVLVCSVLLTGCAGVVKDAETALESKDTFIVCKTVDIITTKIALSSGGTFIESNPLLKMIGGGSSIVPAIALGIGLYFLIDYLDNKTATAAVNAVTCATAGHNIMVLTK